MQDTALFLVDNGEQQDARINLALEEYLVRHYDVFDRTMALLYINAPSVVVGKHQNVWEEVNVPFCRQNNIPVLRRISGGGAVYHDRGNLNIAFITRHTLSNFNNYRYFLQPLLKALKQLQLNAGLDERNNLVIGGRKISGNAQFTSRQTLLSHGTLLFNSDLQMLRSALKVDRRNIVNSKGTPSTPAMVTNVAAHLSNPLNMSSFREHILRVFAFRENTFLRLNENEWAEVRRLAYNKYSAWEWNYGRSPASVISKKIRFATETLPLHIYLEKGRIAGIKSVGGREPEELREAAKALQGLPYEYHALNKKIRILAKRSSLELFDLSELLEGV